MKIKKGDEVMMDLKKWGVVDRVYKDGTILVLDQDGGEHFLPLNRVDKAGR